MWFLWSTFGHSVKVSESLRKNQRFFKLIKSFGKSKRSIILHGWMCKVLYWTNSEEEKITI